MHFRRRLVYGARQNALSVSADRTGCAWGHVLVGQSARTRAGAKNSVTSVTAFRDKDLRRDASTFGRHGIKAMGGSRPQIAPIHADRKDR